MRLLALGACAILSWSIWATEAIEISTGLKISVCKGLSTPDLTCLELWDGIQNAVVYLNYDEKAKAFVGTHQEINNVAELNVEAVITAYHYKEGKVPYYRFIMEITSWVADIPESTIHTTAQVDAPSPDALRLIEIDGDVHVFDTWAALPTLYLGKKDSVLPSPRIY